MKKTLFLLVLSIGISRCFPANYLAADITYKQLTIPPCGIVFCTYEITLTLYTSIQDSVNAPDSVEIKTGDGTTLIVSRTDSMILCNDVLRSQYTINHTYPGTGVYAVSFTDSLSYRKGVNYTNLSNNPYYLESVIVHGSMVSNEKSVFFEDNPLIQADAGKTFSYNPTAIDFDGDSLSFEFLDIDTTGYWIPDSMTINPISGEVIWTNPDSIGIYEFSVFVKEYRFDESASLKIIVGGVIRNFVVKVDTLNISGYFDNLYNWDSNVDGYYEYTIVPGTNFQLPFYYIDSIADSVSVLAFGEVVYLSNPAIFNVILSVNQANCTFNWIPDTSNVRNHPYIVTFLARSYKDTNCIDQYVTLLIYVEMPVSVIENYPNDYEILVYPNPAKDKIFLKGNFDAPALFELYDITGRKALEQTLSGNNNHVNISSMSNGFYIYKLATEKAGYFTGKIIKH